MQITTKGRYAIRAVERLAKAGANDPIAVQHIASVEGISPAYLEQLLLNLTAAQVIKSVRGAGGGFLLSRPPAEISVKEILDAVGEKISLAPCTDEEACSPCPRAADCAVRATWEEATAHLRSYFADLTLATLLREQGVEAS